MRNKTSLFIAIILTFVSCGNKLTNRFIALNDTNRNQSLYSAITISTDNNGKSNVIIKIINKTPYEYYCPNMSIENNLYFLNNDESLNWREFGGGIGLKLNKPQICLSDSISNDTIAKIANKQQDVVNNCNLKKSFLLSDMYQLLGKDAIIIPKDTSIVFSLKIPCIGKFFLAYNYCSFLDNNFRESFIEKIKYPEYIGKFKFFRGNIVSDTVIQNYEKSN